MYLHSSRGLVSRVVRILLRAQQQKNAHSRFFTHLQEKLEIFANVDEIHVPVEPEDVDAAAGATGIEDDGERIGGFAIGGNLPVREGVVLDGLVGGSGRHEVENERDDEERERNHKKRAT